MNEELERLCAAYIKHFIEVMKSLDVVHRGAMSAAMLQVAASYDANTLGPVGAAERLRDMADVVERSRGPADRVRQ